MHPRISVHEVCFPGTMDLDAILSWAELHGVSNVGLFSLRRQGSWAAAISSVAASRVSVAYLCHASMFVLDDPASWPASCRRFMDTVDAAKAMASPIVYVTTGPAGRLEFDEAVEALSRAIIPAREYAAAQGIQLLTETINPLLGHTHFLHTFEDTVHVAAAVGIDVCVDLHPIWHERNIHDKLTAAAEKIKLVQVSDFVPRNMTISRDIVGAGVIPIERLLRTLLRAGYGGVIDLELFARPEATACADTLFSLRRLTEMLQGIGA